VKCKSGIKYTRTSVPDLSQKPQRIKIQLNSTLQSTRSSMLQLRG